MESKGIGAADQDLLLSDKDGDSRADESVSWKHDSHDLSKLFQYRGRVFGKPSCKQCPQSRVHETRPPGF